jgi:hypothetical protein
MCLTDWFRADPAPRWSLAVPLVILAVVLALSTYGLLHLVGAIQ